jgi:hypothetical protein
MLLGGPALFIPAAGIAFFLGLPFALLSSFVRGHISYAEDRKDRRSRKELDAEYELAVMREEAEDERLALREAEKEWRSCVREAKREEAAKRLGGKVIVDNRQIHIHERS